MSALLNKMMFQTLLCSVSASGEPEWLGIDVLSSCSGFKES